MINLSAFTRLQGFTADASAGIAKGFLFINCFWPKLERPTRIFKAGSSGLKVMGATPRNVWFPDDTEFLDYYPDALYPAEQAVFKAFPFRRGLVNLSPVEAQIWLDAYNAAVASFPGTHSVFSTVRDCNFLRYREIVSSKTVTLAADVALSDSKVIGAGSKITKNQYREYVATLTSDECIALVDGKADEAELRATKAFVAVEDSSAMSDATAAAMVAPVAVPAAAVL